MKEDLVRKHFANQEKARMEMRRADANNRLKEGLNTRMQPYHDIIYKQDDEIIYLNKEDKWEGPANVVTVESKTLHILQNGTIRKIAACKARLWPGDDESELDEDLVSELEDSELVENMETNMDHLEEVIEVRNEGEKANDANNTDGDKNINNN